MTGEPKEKPSLLAAMADAYEPSDGDSQRNFQRLAASLDPIVPPRRASWAASAPTTIGLSCIVGALVFGVWSTVRSSAGVPSATSSIASPVVTTEPVTSSPSLPAVALGRPGEAEPPGVSIHELPTAAPTGVAQPKAVPSSTRPVVVDSATPEASTLERETRLIAGADTALREGDARRALALLDEHAVLFPRGWLASERAGERVLVLCALGQQEQATREARAFLSGHTTSPLTRRIERSCAHEDRD